MSENIIDLRGRLKALAPKSGAIAIHLIDEHEGRISMVEAMLRMIEDLVGINRRLLEKQTEPRQSDEEIMDEIQALAVEQPTCTLAAEDLKGWLPPGVVEILHD
jgi:hypothetical protein